MSTLGKIVYLSEAQASELFANGSITVDGSTITYSADDLYLTPENIEYVKKSGDTMTGALNVPEISTVSSTYPAYWYKTDANSSTAVAYHGMRMSDRRFVIAYRNASGINQNFSLPPLSDDTNASTWYDIVTTKDSYVMNGMLTAKTIQTYNGGDGYARFNFKDTTTSSGNAAVNCLLSNNRLFMTEYSPGTTYVERFYLPAPDSNRTAHGDYNILTTKDHPAFSKADIDWTSSSYVEGNYEVRVEKSLDTVRFQGLFNLTGLTANTSVTIGTIPSGYRPRSGLVERTIGFSMTPNWNAPQNIGAGFIFVSVYSDGTVYVNPGATVVNGGFWIDMTWCI